MTVTIYTKEGDNLRLTVEKVICTINGVMLISNGEEALYSFEVINSFEVA